MQLHKVTIHHCSRYLTGHKKSSPDSFEYEENESTDYEEDVEDIFQGERVNESRYRVLYLAETNSDLTINATRKSFTNRKEKLSNQTHS